MTPRPSNNIAKATDQIHMTDWETLITQIARDRIVIAGYPLTEVIKNKSILETVCLLITGEFPDMDLLFWESLNSIPPGGTVNPPPLDPEYVGDPWTTISETDDLFQVPLVNQTYIFSNLKMDTYGWFEAPDLTGDPKDYFWTQEALPDGSTFLASATVTIPEPSTWAFIILGLGALAVRRFRKS